MRIAFYAPLKPPDHPVPSGDRRMARQLLQVLKRAGHAVQVASRLRSWEGSGDQDRQARIRDDAARTAEKLIGQWRDAVDRPQLWFTYHLYHKAPDLLGPPVARALGIPYVVAEASYAAKQAAGPWAAGLTASLEALRQADAVIAMSAVDREGLSGIVDGRRLHRLAPFVDTAPLAAAAGRRQDHRDWWWRGDSGPWLLTVAMMRPGDKQRSYAVLSKALATLRDLDWRLAVVGDGPARDACLAGLDHSRLAILGKRDPKALATLYAAADLFAWPAINEAYGLALVEAQAAGLPVVAGLSGGVPEVVEDGATGLLTPAGDAAAFAAALRALLTDTERRAAMAEAAAVRARTALDISQAVATLAPIIDGAAR